MINDILITGIPRSGTSYLCSILNKVHNTVVINEPEEALQILHNASNVPLPCYYEFIRAKVNTNQPITNKIVDGKFIEDTNVTDARSAYTPDTDRPDFLLGTKNTLIYLNSLDRLAATFPRAAFIACVRHPYDTIASWSNVSFPHLKNAAPWFLLNYVDSKGKRAIDEILQTTDLASRYAMWWNYLAEIITNNSDRLMVIRYEEMVTNPQETLTRIYETLSFPVKLQHPLEPSSPRRHQDALDSHIINAINEHCKDSAALIGYKL